MAGTEKNLNLLDGRLVDFMREVLKVVPLRDRMRMRLCSKGMNALVQETPTVFDKVYVIALENGELRFLIDAGLEQLTIPMLNFLKLMTHRKSEIVKFAYGVIAENTENLLQNWGEEMRRAQLQTITIKDFSWTFFDDNREFGISLFGLLNASKLIFIRFQGSITSDGFQRITETNQWKTCKSLHLGLTDLDFVDYEGLVKQFDKISITVEELSAENISEIIENFLTQNRPRFSEFCVQTNPFGVDENILQLMNGTISDDVCLVNLPLKYDQEMILRVFIYHHVIRGVICKRGKEDSDFGPAKRQTALKLVGDEVMVISGFFFTTT